MNGLPGIVVHDSRRPAKEDSRVFLPLNQITGIYAKESTLAGTREVTHYTTIPMAGSNRVETVETFDEVMTLMAETEVE